ncbi:AlpA family transcriptional regulator [Cryobacterium sp. Hh7]|uniref:helix-turn-helix transcriptional regulator n=1 Tax=Cryobacterium sp. Hh7 TaxID=1259159 RepID=UPI0018E07F35|nr:helix-turn-helix domain-containing protein [Cryobacterium sp. Hh7]
MRQQTTVAQATDKPIMRPAEVAELLGRTTAALAQMRYRGSGPAFIKTGGLVRYRRATVESWLQDGERSHT